MGDTGLAAASGGSKSTSSSNLDSLLSDAALGDALTNTSGGTDLSSLFADAGLLGDSSGLGGVFSTIDPSGSQAASESITPPADAAGTPAGSDPSANIGGTQSGGAPQPGLPQTQQPTPPVSQPSAQDSPLAKIAKSLRSTFGLGEQPTAGGPTGPTPQSAQRAMAAMTPAPDASSGDDQSLPPDLVNPKLNPDYGGGTVGNVARARPAIANLLPTMPTPAETGELPPGGFASPPGTTIAGPASEVLREGEGGPAATPQTAPVSAPPVQPAPAATPAPPAPAPAPAAPDPAQAAPPTKTAPVAPETPEAPPEPSQGVYGPTTGGGGIGPLLRDILGMTLASPVALPMLAQLLGGMGRHRGGIPPWAYHGMMPFMRGTRRGFVGFRGGFLRPGYYPRRQGGWGFHPGGYHPGWGAWAPGMIGNQPMPSAAAGGEPGGWRGANVQSGGAPDRPGAGADQAWSSSGLASNPFLNTLVGQESGGGQNIVSRTDKDSRGLTLAQGGNPSEISQGYFQIQNHPGGTWSTYARRAGVDLSQYPTPRSAPLEVQWKVAQMIPISAWGHDTQVALQRRGFRYSPSMTLGQVAQQSGGVNPTAVASNPSSTTSRGAPGTPPANIRIHDPENPIHDYPAPTETSGAPPAQPVQSDDFAEAG
ncbi:MAG TPA: hypothetical protein VGG68_11565 [Caulobacteraceae bacterium]|jgi:hypothetical protein